MAKKSALKHEKKQPPRVKLAEAPKPQFNTDEAPVIPSTAHSNPFLAEHSEQNEIADLKKRVTDLEDVLDVRKTQFEDLKLTVFCIIKTVKKVEEMFGQRLMPKGDFYGIKFE